MSDDAALRLPAADYLAHLDTESRRFSEVLADADPAVPVPSCPEWSAADLVWHLTEVQWFWGSIAGGPIVDADEIEAVEEAKPPRPDGYPDLLALFESAQQRLAAAIADGPDDSPLWSWAAEQSLGFTRRRQAHEALIHRVDAELTAGVPVGPLDPALAADGIDEVLTVMWAIPAWSTFNPGGGVIAIEATDTGGAWLVEIGRMTGTSTYSGKTYDELAVAVLPGKSRESEAQVRGTASDLDLWFWNRGSTGIVRTGDQSAQDALTTLIADGVQ